jgi:hypothetical protein
MSAVEGLIQSRTTWPKFKVPARSRFGSQLAGVWEENSTGIVPEHRISLFR